MNKELVVDCPRCKRSFKYYTSESRPFCSQKCKLIDLGQWLDGSFVLKGQDHTVYIEDTEAMIELMNNEDNE